MIFPILLAALGGCSVFSAGDNAPTAASNGGAGSSDESQYASWLDVTVTREILVPSQINGVFEFITAQDVLPKILTGYGLVPGVVSTSDVSGPWDVPGSSRTVHLRDGSTAHEQVTRYEKPGYFAYRVSEPTFSLRYLIVDARGQWWMTASGDATQVKWTYTFRAKGPLSRLLLVIFANTQWTGYMNVCLRNIVRNFMK